MGVTLHRRVKDITNHPRAMQDRRGKWMTITKPRCPSTRQKEEKNTTWRTIIRKFNEKGTINEIIAGMTKAADARRHDTLRERCKQLDEALKRAEKAERELEAIRETVQQHHVEKTRTENARHEELLEELKQLAANSKEKRQAETSYEVGEWDRTLQERRHQYATQLIKTIDRHEKAFSRQWAHAIRRKEKEIRQSHGYKELQELNAELELLARDAREETSNQIAAVQSNTAQLLATTRQQLAEALDDVHRYKALAEDANDVILKLKKELQNCETRDPHTEHLNSMDARMKAFMKQAKVDREEIHKAMGVVDQPTRPRKGRNRNRR